MIPDSKVIEDAFSLLDAGMNSDLDYTILPRNQAAFLVNATCRGGFAESRPGLKRWNLTFDTEEAEDLWNTGLFQGSYTYQGGTMPMVIVSIGGHIFRVRLDNFTVSDITIPGNPNSSLLPMAWMEQAENWLIIQDNQSSALIFDGSSLRRSNVANLEVPRGSVMAYGMGRLWVCINGNQFVAGDIVGGSSGTPAYNYRDAVLRFTENNFIAGGGAFSVPLLSGEITAMKFVANLNIALGQGSLMVFTRRGVFSVQPPIDRLQWADMTAPIMTVAQINYGSVSPYVTPVNGDLFYRSVDGMRSLVVGVRNFGSWGNVPISTEMNNPMESDLQTMTPFCHSVLFDNRLLMTTLPWKTPRGISFRGFVALDFSLISSLRGQAPPAYDGVWTGLKSVGVFKAEIQNTERVFAWHVNADYEIELWEFTKADWFDTFITEGTKTVRKIEWLVESPGLFCNGTVNSPQNGSEMKELQYGDLWIDRIRGQARMQIQFRPDHYPFWVEWFTMQRCTVYEDCEQTPACKTFTQSQPQYRARMRLPTAPDGCEDANQKVFKNFYSLQIRLQFRGKFRLNLCRMFARQLEESAEGDCDLADEPCYDQAGCTLNPFNYLLT